MDVDFLDLVAFGDEREYEAAYQNAFNHVLTDHSAREIDAIPRADPTSTSTTFEHSNAWRLGVLHGSQLSSEICYYLGMCTEILRRHQPQHVGDAVESGSSAGTQQSSKRDASLVRVSTELHHLLTVSPGLVTATDGELNHDTLDADLARIRGKAKHLSSLLDVQVLNRDLHDLTF